MKYLTIVPSRRFDRIVPWVLTGLSGLGVIGTAVAAAKATPKALERKRQAEEEKGEELTLWEKVRAMAPSYLPAAGIGAATVAGITATQMVNDGQKEALIGTVLAGQQMHQRYRRKVEEKAPEVAREIDLEMAKEEWLKQCREKVKNSEKTPRNFFFRDVKDYPVPMLFYLEYGGGLKDENGNEGVFFEATPGDLLAALYEMNYQLSNFEWSGGWVSINDFLTYLDKPQCKTNFGEKTGFDACWMYDEYGMTWLDLATPVEFQLEDNVPEPLTCNLLKFYIDPHDESYDSYEEAMKETK